MRVTHSTSSSVLEVRPSYSSSPDTNSLSCECVSRKQTKNHDKDRQVVEIEEEQQQGQITNLQVKSFIIIIALSFKRVRNEGPSLLHSSFNLPPNTTNHPL